MKKYWNVEIHLFNDVLLSYNLYLFIPVFIYLFIHLLLYLFIPVFIYLFKHLFKHLFSYLNIYLSIYLFIPIFIHAFFYLYLGHFKSSIQLRLNHTPKNNYAEKFKWMHFNYMTLFHLFWSHNSNVKKWNFNPCFFIMFIQHE